MKRETIVLIGLLAVIAGGLAAGTHDFGTISGKITDAETGHPVAGAWIAIIENNLGATTDSLGQFTISDVPPGSYTMIVTHVQFGTISGLKSLSVSVVSGKKVQVDIPLKRSAQKMREEATVGRVPQPVGDILVENFAGIADREVKTQSGSQKKDRDIIVVSGIHGSDYTPQSFGRVGNPVPARPGTVMERDEMSLPPFDMFFTDYGTNGFIDTQRDRFSTFAVDVDDASYTLVRRYLEEGNVPPQEAIRVEEFINHFDYGYNNPSRDKFRVFTELTDSPFDRNVKLLKIGVKGREVDAGSRKPLNLTLVVDVSGSMGYDNRMQLVKESLRMLVRQLDSNDRIGIVAYDNNARVLLEPMAAGSRRAIQVIHRAIDQLQPGGSTNAEAGMTVGYRMANRQFENGHNNVVMLLSDGVANVGSTGSNGIMARIGECARQGLTLNSIGFGMGNYNDALLEQLAQKGNGRYAYVNDCQEAQKTFVEDFVANTQILGRDVKVQVEFDPSRVTSYRLLGYENRDVADHRFRDNTQDGGEIFAGHEVTALYEIVLAQKLTHKKRNTADLATVFVRWKDADETEVAELKVPVSLQKHFSSFDSSRPELRLACVAGRFAEMLKGTAYATETSFEDLYRTAKPLERELPSEQTDELLDLIQRAGNLSIQHTEWHGGDDDNYVNNYRRR